MKRGGLRLVLYGVVGVLYVLHNDLWLWHDPRVVLGLPVGLLYHVLYCLAVTLVMALLVRFAWPASPSPSPADPEDRRARAP